jgi:hypothetical protein
LLDRTIIIFYHVVVNIPLGLAHLFRFLVTLADQTLTEEFGFTLENMEPIVIYYNFNVRHSVIIPVWPKGLSEGGPGYKRCAQFVHPCDEDLVDHCYQWSDLSRFCVPL